MPPKNKQFCFQKIGEMDFYLPSENENAPLEMSDSQEIATTGLTKVKSFLNTYKAEGGDSVLNVFFNEEKKF